MTEQSLKDKTAKGLFWGGVSNGVQQLLNLFFGIFLARLLTPADYGMVGMLTIFSALASILQEGGFISALTNRKKTEHKDYNAVFWFSILMGTSLYTLLYICAPLIADFYQQPELTNLARLSFLGFLISSTNVAPRAFLFKHLKTKENAIISFLSLAISGIVGITLAANGFAYWGIAIQTIAYTLTMTIFSYYFSDWRPSLKIDFTPIREMIGYSSKLIVTHTFHIINANLFSVILGKFYTEKEVGYFNQANKWNTMGYTTINGMITSVAQPVLSSISEDKGYQLKALRKMLRFTAFISFPAMFGLSLTAPELITLAITDKWLPSAQMMQILCIGGAFLPLSNLLSQLLLSRGHSSIYMWSTISLSLLQLATAYIAYPYGLPTMLYAFILINISWIFVWIGFVHREIGLTCFSFLKDICPYLLLSGILVISAHYLTLGIEHPGIRLVCKTVGVGGLYILVLWLMKSVILQESIAFFLKKKK
jgi:O-antigen/teichoic acid export membrane protein